MPETFAFENATIFDGTGREPYSNGAVVVSDGRIQAVGPMTQVSTPRHAEVIDLAGKTVMPGLIDAHAHVGFVEQNFADDTENRHPGAIYGYSVARNIEDTLMHGFTTIRDAGGCDWSFKLAVERGMIKGPRMFVSNSFISQTGGHGDMRQRHERTGPRRYHPLMPQPAICDGEAEARKAARDQLRAGADQLKVMAGGGAASPTSLLDSPQFTASELAAITYEARVVKKPVMAHVYVPEGIRNCAQAGVRSIEHGNFMDEESASLMMENGMFLVPTLSVYELISTVGHEQGASDSYVEKITMAKGAASQSVEIAMAAGVAIGSGSDVYGPNGNRKAFELELKAAIMGSIASLVSATRTNAELVGMGDQIGTLEPGKLADLIVVDGNPVEDIALLQDETKIVMVVQSGNIVKGA